MKQLLHLLAVVTFVGSIAVAGGASGDGKYGREFQTLIGQADRLVVRDGGYNCCGPVDGQAVLLIVTNRQAIGELSGMIQFESNRTWSACMCCGYPGLDWYRGKQRIALTSLQHGQALRWKGFPGDARLTPVSSERVIEWLAQHGIAGPKAEVEAGKRRAAIGQQARQLFSAHVPEPFLRALSGAARAAATRGSGDSSAPQFAEDTLKEEYIRKAFPNGGSLYAALFRILGCLPMHWDARFVPEQDEAYRFLVGAPRDELDRAFRAAAGSGDKSEKHGAARFLFSQFYMTNHGKTEQDMAQWMALLAAEAYTDPFPENRRLVLHRLLEAPNTDAMDVLKQGVEDPDVVVRRKAIAALAAMKSPERQALLRQVARGGTRPRGEVADRPMNYGEGSALSFNTPGMENRQYTDTDAEAASRALQAPALFEDLGHGVTKRTWLREDGTKWCEAYSLNGKDHGTYTEWWPDGKVMRTIEWRDDNRHGKSALYDRAGHETERSWYFQWQEVTEKEFQRREAQARGAAPGK